MSEANIMMFVLGYAALLVIIGVGYVVKLLYFTWEVRREGDEIEVSRLVGRGRYYRYVYNAATKNQTLYSLVNGVGKKYFADWNGRVQEIYVVGEKGVLTRKELDQRVPAAALHPLFWKYFEKDEIIQNKDVNPAEIYDRKFKKITVGYRLREVAMDFWKAGDNK